MEFKVLDKGFLRLVDILGDDYSAVKAARVSYGKGIKTPEKDKNLIFYLMEHKHETPFEHIVFTFHVKTPIFVARQWFRHRIGSFNEASLRYTELKDEFYLPDHIRKNIVEDKQKAVRVEELKLKEQALELIYNSIEDSYKVYRKLLELGVAREMARIVLPMSSYTQFYWTVNARSLMNFLNLRADSHAQWEIQQYAIKIAKIFKEKCPWTFESFLKFNYRGDILREVEL
ncbi:thymidylate synthase [Thermosipho melanesiensis]|uniref:Flavin-dependent thymidylate synthase n=2 Tax=Thermosipho melanesiensis TaxID=46541 RepID=THYX_THEM4|nr:FAD-dependent thymidylate synthase [Thermosipho melanesiensis]A6LP90.1 RecName: Full=Flavin-dependent thymidylate synthase; Short=FDTS; AltName: Full=FAD-dependent thymidylate synthase; AltName: Full=Thymidylate synthase ThyX; Short=TS; Short=TSase [Thermosipho melanesiensis BI429]ABR31741.1 thymidylate synthase, flavin-dependent [Thermosipho melanesiensis BI429]APT74763.1 thymidylate synthase [Thermosipho melanesiensis]OOC35082.1 thymidylate synthase [Thermosipho melanesiensis]OOC35118.1 t